MENRKTIQIRLSGDILKFVEKQSQEIGQALATVCSALISERVKAKIETENFMKQMPEIIKLMAQNPSLADIILNNAKTE